MYKKRSDFTSADEYALYIRNHCAIGMSVRCCRSYEEEVYEGDTGVIVKINYGELHDLNLQVSILSFLRKTKFTILTYVRIFQNLI